jgi:uncharacterized protein with PIN domain
MSDLEAVVWCPVCKEDAGRIFREQVNATVWRNVTEPATLPKYCNRCESVIERRRG